MSEIRIELLEIVRQSSETQVVDTVNVDDIFKVFFELGLAGNEEQVDFSATEKEDIVRSIETMSERIERNVINTVSSLDIDFFDLLIKRSAVEFLLDYCSAPAPGEGNGKAKIKLQDKFDFAIKLLEDAIENGRKIHEKSVQSLPKELRDKIPAKHDWWPKSEQVVHTEPPTKRQRDIETSHEESTQPCSNSSDQPPSKKIYIHKPVPSH